ncbi:uncharacterized protein LOC129916245 isoform X2 [Episyrphus balteatus]|uniref:uncharacterized protein LOC129916245 isoform X2 n=1 Tax=Episyrphus balteatus TaxID=286459 RepID=UPI0024853A48|nr:uncharacterized protein LOC129916245 isoform X2 [Episyrphus balteatus]
MDNISKITIDDSSASMYFSFNSTTACNKIMETTNDNYNSMAIEDDDEDEECDQNNTLEAVAKAIPKNILKAYKALSSTPTKAQLLRSVEVNRGSSAVVVDVCDLGLAFLEAPQESINSVLSEDKENQPQESQEIIYSETSSEIVVSVIEKTQLDEEKPIKRVGFSNLPVFKSSGNSNVRGGTPKVRRSIPRHEPDLVTNRPSRIVATKRMSTIPNPPNSDLNSDEIPKMINSILKISKGLPSNRKSIGNQENPFNLLGKATRMSIVKTTLNSPARKVSRKSLTSIQVGKNYLRHSLLPINKGRSTVGTSTVAPSTLRRSVVPSNSRKSMLPTTVTSPKKRIVARKSMMMPPIASSSIPNSRKSMVPKTTSLLGTGLGTKPKTTLTKLKEDFICDVCSRKFLVLSLFEAHKRTHEKVASASASSTKQTFFSNSDNKCRYCDKKFAIPKALSNHLIQNCTKIPPGDKKKLLFPTDQKTIVTQSQSSKLPPKSASNLSSCDSISSNNTTQISKSQLNTKTNNGDCTMPPPSSTNKLKKKLAHSGVYCTPKKQITCHICKMSFNNILAFTEHKLSHSNAKSDEQKSESTEIQIDVKSDNTTTAQQKINDEDGVVPLK